MTILNAAFLFDLESNMRVITENSYTSLLEKQWWNRVAREMPSSSLKERIIWLLETGFVDYGVEGQVQFVDMATVMQEFTNKFITGSGLKMLRSQLEDLDGVGISAATAWSRTMGALAANFPQQELAKAIHANGVCYDGLAYFHANAGGTTGHPYDPTDTTKGRFANLFTGAASAGVNPGACPIDVSVTLDVAQTNLSKALTYIREIKQPNGVNPRNLEPVAILVPQQLYVRARLVTEAKSVAMPAAGGAGSADVTALISTFGLEVILCPELGALYGGSDTRYYILCKDSTGQLGAWVYVNREPFSITYHGPQTDAQLASKREYEWTPQGRSTVGPGHPYLMFRCDGT
jgi:hypothetical protein